LAVPVGAGTLSRAGKSAASPIPGPFSNWE